MDIFPATWSLGDIAVFILRARVVLLCALCLGVGIAIGRLI